MNPSIKKHAIDIVVFIGIMILITAAWLYSWRWVDLNIMADSHNTTLDANAAVRGQFGDKFGAISSLFSGLAFAGVIFTILLQRRDLNETRNAMCHERFDNTFFQLLNLHIEITSKLSARGHDGLEAFVAFNEYLKKCDSDFHVFCAMQKISRDKVRQIIDTKTVAKTTYPELNDADISNITEYLNTGVGALSNYLDDSIELHERKIVSAYIKACLDYIDYFSHYFRNLYHILKFINESELISETEKCHYSKFVRSQLSEAELIVLFYNSLAKIGLPGREDMELGHPKMAKLLVRFDILQNMNPRSIIHPLHKAIFLKNNVVTK